MVLGEKGAAALEALRRPQNGSQLCQSRFGGAIVVCPRCGKKYRRRVTWCPDCVLPLVNVTADAESHSPALPLELLTVFPSRDPGRVGLAESLLRSAGIPYVSRWNLGLQVAREDAEDARALLSDLEEYSSEAGAVRDDAGNM